jgi:hypothetical protein
MTDEPRRGADQLCSAAERLDSLAEIAELMGDNDTAASFRSEASGRRMQAMELLDPQ